MRGTGCGTNPELIAQEWDPELYVQNAQEIEVLLDHAFIRGDDAVWHKRFKGVFKQVVRAERGHFLCLRALNLFNLWRFCIRIAWASM